MFHLFRKTYLEHDFRFTSQHDSMMASGTYLQDPLLDNVMGSDTVHKADSLEDILEQRFDSNRENLWRFLLNPNDSNKRFLLYLDEGSYNQLQIQYWKSSFKSLSLEDCYLLHKFHIQDLKLKTGFIVSKINTSMQNYHEHINILDIEQFRSIFEKEEVSPVLESLSIDDRSYEYLLANYFFSDNEQVKSIFLKKLKYFSWKMLVDEINILRSEVVNGMYDFLSYDVITKKEKHNVAESIDSVLGIVKADPSIMWVVDTNINANNIDYIKTAYSAKSFTDFIGNHFGVSYKNNDTKLKDEKFESAFDLVFNDQYIELLNLDIEGGFGSLFFTNAERFRVNLLLIGYFYELSRKDDIETLKKFEVCGHDL